MSVGIKRSAIPASGYMYQTLVGIKLLCDWLDTPSLYDWVKFEADDEKDAQGLDDIVAQRIDGRVDLIQVKFTVDVFDPSNALSWSWLTTRKGQRGRSLLEKWSSAFFRVGLARLGAVRLITNRRPDAAFTLHLADVKVRWESLPEGLRQELEPHLGGAESAALFFENFEFSHSFAGYESLGGTVSSALEGNHTDHLGWLTLLRRATEWSIHKNAPAPDGRITLEVLRSTISERQPRPLDQEFRVPAGYLPPDPQFAKEFIDEIQSGDWNERVLWGSPGQGKSTFLSYICEQLRALGMQVVRHHYFLDLQDSSDRFSLTSVARSMMSQLLSDFPADVAHLEDKPEQLRNWIEACGRACLEQGRRLVVVVDGLDHVWRENDEEIRPLNELFKQLLPAPQGITLILGTQRVSEDQLPRRMHSGLDPHAWVELPRMQMTSIIAWLRGQHEAGVFQLPPGDPTERQLALLSEAFMALSEGHPLVLTYMFMKVAHDRRVVSLATLQQVDFAPQGDARVYYQTLWQRLSWSVRDALHLLAEDRFIWPTGALEHCLELRDVNLEAEIGHLLATVDAGLQAFHGSLYVFIAQQPDHQRRVEMLRPKVEAWLDKLAPEYLRWAWLWLYESRRGDQHNLLSGTTRGWVLDALRRACEVGQIVRILKAAELVAFDAGYFEIAIRKRALKHRVENGLAYQLEDADALRECALQLTPDPYPALLLASQVNQSKLLALQQLATLYLSLDQVERASEVQERMRSKINDRLRAKTLKARDYEEAISRYLQVAAGTGRYEPDSVLKLLRRHRNSVELFERFLTNASRAEDLEGIMVFANLPMPARLRRVFEVQAVRVAGWAGAKLQDWQQFLDFRKHPLSACWSLLYQPKQARRIPQVSAHDALAIGSTSNDEDDFARYLHFLFFAAVAQGLAQKGAPTPSWLGVQTEKKWLSAILLSLGNAANATAAILARGEIPPASVVYRLVVSERPAHSDHEAWSDLRAVRRALVLITADIFLLTRTRSGAPHLPATEWGACKASGFFALEHWRSDFLMCNYRLLDAVTAHAYIAEQVQAARHTVGPFNEKATALADLCSWATAYGLRELAHELLERTYEYAIGYGWRKDPGLAVVLEVVGDIAKRDPAAAVQAVSRLAPIYDQIDVMTEDSGSRPCDLAALLWQLLPEVYVRCYRHFLSQGEWYYADHTFAVFAKRVDLSAPESAVALSVALGEQTVQALQTRSRTTEGAVIPSQVRLWDPDLTTGLKAGETLNEQAQTHASLGGAPDLAQPDAPNFEHFPPARLGDFLAEVGKKVDYQLRSTLIQNWLMHWDGKGNGAEILRALEQLLQDGGSTSRGTELLDPAFHLALRLQGPKPAFVWLVRAHQYRYGWSERHYGYSESIRRLELVGKHYPKRWKEFLARSSLPAPNSYVQERAIPDAGIVRLLLEVNDLERAKSVFETMIDIVVEEFSAQPLEQPEWWQEPGA